MSVGRERSHGDGPIVAVRAVEGLHVEASARPDDGSLDAQAVREAARAKLFGATRAKPVMIGRYAIERRLGAGGMGEVFAALDPELGRRVAVKLVANGLGVDDPTANARLLREARALAQIDHPNVVPIHDVGTLGERIWLAMEYIDGQTLRQWRATPRTRMAILDVIVRAGRGLAAAHARGVVHRDFKPDNVMVAPSDAERPDQVRVTDFGLAAWDHGRVVTESDTARGDVPVTRAGVGTLGYIAPEVLAGAPPTVASDQYSFCATAYEALTGERPSDDGVPPRAAAGLPRWIRRVLDRGLVRDPQGRHGSVALLVDALARDPGRRVRLLLAAGTAVAGVAAAVLWSNDAGRCRRDEAALAATWDDDARKDIASAFAATEAPFAADAAKVVGSSLDRWADAWLDARLEACVASVTGGVVDDLQARRVACLDGQRIDTRELVTRLRTADRRAVQLAVRAVGDLPRPIACDDAEVMGGVTTPTDPRIADDVRAIEGTLARIRAMASVGDFAGAREIADGVVEQAIRVGHRPTLADARFERGRIMLRVGEYAAAETDLRTAVWDAQASAHDRLAARSAALLVAVVGYALGQADRAEQWAEQASALLDRTGGDRAIEATRLSGLGLVRDGQGKIAEAIGFHQQALALRRAALGEDHQLTLEAHVNLGVDAMVSGDRALAESELGEALAGYERTLGPQHPEVGAVLTNLTALAYDRGDHARAVELGTHAHALLAAAFGELHPETVIARSNLARPVARLGRVDEGIAHSRAAMADAVVAFGERHPERARFGRVLGELLLLKGDAAAARRELGNAVDVLVTAGDPTAAEAQLELARAEARDGAVIESRVLVDAVLGAMPIADAAVLAQGEIAAADRDRDSDFIAALERWAGS